MTSRLLVGEHDSSTGLLVSFIWISSDGFETNACELPKQWTKGRDRSKVFTFSLFLKPFFVSFGFTLQNIKQNNIRHKPCTDTFSGLQWLFKIIKATNLVCFCISNYVFAKNCTNIFPRLAPVARFRFKVWLANCDILVCCDWVIDFGFSFAFMTVVRKPLSFNQ